MGTGTVIPCSFKHISLHYFCSLSFSLLIAPLDSLLILTLNLGFYLSFGYLILAISLLFLLLFCQKDPKLEIDSLLGQDFKTFLICSKC